MCVCVCLYIYKCMYICIFVYMFVHTFSKNRKETSKVNEYVFYHYLLCTFNSFRLVYLSTDNETFNIESKSQCQESEKHEF